MLQFRTTALVASAADAVIVFKNATGSQRLIQCVNDVTISECCVTPEHSRGHTFVKLKQTT
jgi:hypothetical protein